MTHAVYSQAARRWLASGRSSTMLQQGEWPLRALYSWVHSEGFQFHDDRDVIREWLNASKAAKNASAPGWYGHFLKRDAGCPQCGCVKQADLMSVCTLCHQLSCSSCARHGTVPNGNRRHSCGGELV